MLFRSSESSGSTSGISSIPVMFSTKCRPTVCKLSDTGCMIMFFLFLHSHLGDPHPRQVVIKRHRQLHLSPRVVRDRRQSESFSLTLVDVDLEEGGLVGPIPIVDLGTEVYVLVGIVPPLPRVPDPLLGFLQSQ